MGNTSHIAKFCEGARAWNAWRAENPAITPDLRDLVPHLGEKQLGPAHGGPIDLNDALLNCANLHSATLLGARLNNADLRHANLALALLAGADLSFANLSNAVLDHADLANVSLQGAIIEGARLDLARNLAQTQIDEAHGDARTTLPPHLQMPDSWRASEHFAEPDVPLGDDEEFHDYEPHEVLGLARGAGAEAIRSAYLKLAKKYHPDLNASDLIAERRFKKINEAYQQLILPAAPPPAQPRRGRGTTWGTAMAMFLGALAAPSIALYSLGMPPFKPEPRQATRIAPSPAADVAMLTETGRAPIEADYTGALPSSPAEMAASGKSDRGPLAETPNPPAAQSEPLQPPTPQTEERSATSADVPPATPPALPIPIPAPWPPERLAALQPPSPASAETPTEPAEEEWKTLQRSSELQALNNFIQRYRERPAADEARSRFKNIVAGLDKVDELQKFVRETTSDSPERMLAKSQLAMLVEKEVSDADHRAWNETRERGTVAALRAYLLSYPDGEHAPQAEERLSDLEEASSRKKDAAAWVKAARNGTRSSYEAYLDAQPEGQYVALARRKIAALSATEATAQKDKDHAAWRKANRERTPRAYGAYLEAYPDGQYASIAQETLDRGDQSPRPGPRRAASDVPRAPYRSEPRWPSPDEPFIERIQRP
jgi:DnaJ-domain-containing protein 1